MKTAWIRRAVVVAVLAGSTAVWGDSEAVLDRYTSIPQRNAFALKPPPPPPEPVKPALPPPAITLKLTAIVSLPPTKKAILLVSQPGKPPESKVLAENQAENGVEVKSINPETGSVKVAVNGEESELNFDKDGVKPTLGAALSAAPAPPPAPVSASALFASAANGKPSTAIGPASGASLASFLQQASSVASSSAGSHPVVPSVGYGGVPGGLPNPIAGQTFRFDGGATTPPAQQKWPPEEPVTHEQSIIHMEILRELQRTGKMTLPPLPPTMMTPPDLMPPVAAP